MFVQPSILLFIGLPSREGERARAFIEDGIGVALRRMKGLIEQRERGHGSIVNEHMEL